MPRDRRMVCTSVIGISSQIQRFKKMIEPITDKSVFIAAFRHFSTYFLLIWRKKQQTLVFPSHQKCNLCWISSPGHSLSATAAAKISAASLRNSSSATRSNSNTRNGSSEWTTKFERRPICRRKLKSVEAMRYPNYPKMCAFKLG